MITMITSESAARFNLFLIQGFFDAPTCENMLAEMCSAQSNPATVYRDAAAGTIDERMRKTTRLVMSPATVEMVRRRLLERKEIVEDHFKVSLSDCEEPQFLRYTVGDFFVAHQDGNTGLIRFDRERVRRVSVSIFLNDQAAAPEPGTYGGGSLVFHRPAPSASREDSLLHLGGEAGLLVAFRPETTHEVTPVTRGERYSIACWYK